MNHRSTAWKCVEDRRIAHNFLRLMMMLWTKSSVEMISLVIIELRTAIRPPLSPMMVFLTLLFACPKWVRHCSRGSFLSLFQNARHKAMRHMCWFQWISKRQSNRWPAFFVIHSTRHGTLKHEPRFERMWHTSIKRNRKMKQINRKLIAFWPEQ